jgi:uncharacterized protein (DUF488 family)
MAPPPNGLTLWSIGHSTHTLNDFVRLLRAHGVLRLADIRTVPRSRRQSHFDAKELALSLPAAGIEYAHVARLGGFRRASEGSPNAGWRNLSFRGYADYALTEEFAAGLAELRQLACAAPTAMMCSEALWWRCHRRLVSDRLVVGGDVVWHISSTSQATAHELTPFAVVNPDGQITYPSSTTG